jgi:hypothetical protein
MHLSTASGASHRVIVYVDDADHARQLLQPLCAQPSGRATHWFVVACAPRMTHRISKWVSHSARENWRIKWADKLFAQMLPWLRSGGGSVTTVLAKGPLAELSEQLQAEHGAAQVVDARRPKAEAPGPAAAHAPGRWSLPNTLAGLGALFLLVASD